MQLRGQPPPQKRGLSIGLGDLELFVEPRESVLLAFEASLRLDDAFLPASVRAGLLDWGMLPSREESAIRQLDTMLSSSVNNTDDNQGVSTSDEDVISLQFSYPEIWLFPFSRLVEFDFALLSIDNRIQCKCGIVLPCEVDFGQMAPELFALMAASYCDIQAEVEIYGLERVCQSLFIDTIAWQEGPVMISRIKKAA